MFLLPSVFALRVRGADMKATLRLDRPGGPRSRAETWEIYLSGPYPQGAFSVDFPCFGDDDEAGYILTCLQVPERGGMTNESGKAFIYTFARPHPHRTDEPVPNLWVHYLPKPPPMLVRPGVEAGLERMHLGKDRRRKSEGGEVEALVGGDGESESEEEGDGQSAEEDE